MVLRRACIVCWPLGRHAPQTCVGLEVRDVAWVFVLLVSRPCRLDCVSGWTGCGRTHRPGADLLTRIEQMLLVDGIGYLGCLAKEIKVFPNSFLAGLACCRAWTTEGLVVEGIIRLVQPITETVVRLFEVQAGVRSDLACESRTASTHASSSSSSSCVAGRAMAANGSGFCPKPGALTGWPWPRGRLVLKPKNDMTAGRRQTGTRLTKTVEVMAQDERPIDELFACSRLTNGH